LETDSGGGSDGVVAVGSGLGGLVAVIELVAIVGAVAAVCLSESVSRLLLDLCRMGKGRSADQSDVRERRGDEAWRKRMKQEKEGHTLEIKVNRGRKALILLEIDIAGKLIELVLEGSSISLAVKSKSRRQSWRETSQQGCCNRKQGQDSAMKDEPELLQLHLAILCRVVGEVTLVDPDFPVGEVSGVNGDSVIVRLSAGCRSKKKYEEKSLAAVFLAHLNKQVNHY
jgi:hypothetical protein